MSEPNFADLGIRESLLANLTSLGYEAPTPIQQRTIPVLLAGRDVIGQAQTGTGKTAAFALPLLEKIDPQQRQTQALVLTPTRELAVQVAEALHSYAHGTQVTVLPVYGGAPIVPQLKRLDRGVQVVVGTPGRLIDVLDRKSLRLDDIRMVVVDEADEMLKMGFIDDVEKLLAATPSTRQIALFSATMPPEILRIAKRHMPDAERIEIEHKSVSAPAIEQRFLNVSEAQKLDVLTQILEVEENEAVLVFRRTKTGAAELAERLEGRGFAAQAMHGDMKQSERESVIRRLRARQVEIVVATDVAARGLDVEQITHVINYDIPNDVEAYVHRIGRTGRAGRAGVAILFITPRERRMMREIERFTGAPIKPMKMPTRADVAAKRVSLLKDSIRKTIGEGDLDLYLELVEQLVEEGTADVAEIAAAAARLASVAKPLAVEPETERVAPEAETAPARETKAAARPAPRTPFERAAQSARPQSAGVRLRMDVGKADGIRPADVVGSIANEAGIAGRDIGPIDIRDDVTFVTVPAESAEHVVKKVAHARFRGRPVNLRIAGEESEAPRPRFADRESRPPRREYDRERSPRREVDGERPRREFGGARPVRREFDRPRAPRGEYDSPRPRRFGDAREERTGTKRPPFAGKSAGPRRDGDAPKRPNAFDRYSRKPGSRGPGASRGPGGSRGPAGKGRKR